MLFFSMRWSDEHVHSSLLTLDDVILKEILDLIKYIWEAGKLPTK